MNKKQLIDAIGMADYKKIIQILADMPEFTMEKDFIEKKDSQYELLIQEVINSKQYASGKILQDLKKIEQQRSDAAISVLRAINKEGL